MQRPLAVLAAAACGLLLFSVVANLIAIQKSDPARMLGRRSPVVERDPSVTPPARPDSSDSEEPVDVIVHAEALTERLLRENALGPLVERGPLPYTARTRVLMESKASGRWITVTEVRAPCADVDRALARVADRSLGQPDRCERWVETTAAVLERHGVSTHSARQFLKEHEVETSVRVLLVYAGWHKDPADGNVLVLASAGAAPVYPRESFMTARTTALDGIYRTLRLGPYAEG